MNLTFSQILSVLYIFILLDVFLVILIFVYKMKNEKSKKKINQMNEFIISKFKILDDKEKGFFINKNKSLFFNQFIELSQLLILSNNEEVEIIKFLLDMKLDKFYAKRLKFKLKIKRIESAVFLGYLPSERSKKALMEALKKEKNYSVKLYISNSLFEIKEENSIPIMVSSLRNSPTWYQEKMHILLSDFGQTFYEYIPSIIKEESLEIQRLIIYFSSIYMAEDLKKFLLDKIQGENKEIAYKAMEVFGKTYPNDLNNELFLENKDSKIRNLALNSLERIKTKENLFKLMEYLKDEEGKKYAIYSISKILEKEPQYTQIIEKNFSMEKDDSVKNALAEILSNKIEYFLLKLLSKDRDEIKAVLREIIKLHKINGIMGFLNRNKNIELENEILSIIREEIRKDRYLLQEFTTYLDERLVKKLKEEKKEPIKIQKENVNEKNKIIILYLLLMCIILIFPGVYMLRHSDILKTTPLIEQLKIYIIDFNYYLVFYSVIINSIYFILLILSFKGVKKQIRYWNVKKNKFLFKKRMLPSVSIIAPAYCEEATIVESVNSLLNLKYPNYELIVVNDGSSDETLNTLIRFFSLEKVDMLIENSLKTMPIRGVYRNKYLPKLIVVDKVNGGKADSINSGINVSKNEYFCCIDADSLLESEALTKIASLTIDEEYEVAAVGGNIFPINGCTVDRGFISNIEIPENSIARFQTIEYIRAFMTGRLGWAYVNSLLIISGAFGLFKRDRIIEIGGYLTSSERFKKDTVGEDMELVVRLTRHLREANIKHRIMYAYNANCWTEVPESLKILNRQRDRWQRGLIDIIIFHIKTLGNPSYGRMGLVALPYFFIFEMMGPLMEIQGYFMVLLAAILGILNKEIALMLFITSIMFGTFISIASLIIAEKEGNYYSFKEILILVLYSVIENFGFRQMISFWRFTGYISSLKKPKGWGKMERKGFTN